MSGAAEDRIEAPSTGHESSGSVHLERGVRDRIERAAVRALPREACGLLVGRRRAHDLWVQGAVRVANRAPGPAARRYELDLRAFLRLDRLAVAAGLAVVGVWHSHPDLPAEPSPADRRAAWPDLDYLIVSIRDGRAVEWRCWYLPESPEAGAEMRERPLG